MTRQPPPATSVARIVLQDCRMASPVGRRKPRPGIRWVAGALLGTALLAVPLQADWTVVWEVSRQARGIGGDPNSVTVLLKGERARFEPSPTVVVVVDGATGRIYRLDPAAGTYTVTVPGADSSPVPAGVVLPPGMVMPRQEASGTLEAASGTRAVAGRPTRRYAASSTLRMEMPGDPAARMPSFRTEGEMWVGEGNQPAPAAMAALLPLLLADEEEQGGRAQQKMDRKIDRIYGLDMESLRRSHESSLADSLASMLQPITEQLAALGRPVLAARLSLSLGPGVPPTDFVAAATSIAEASHDEALFTVPAGYRRVGSDPDVPPEGAATGPTTPVPAAVASFDRLIGVYSLPNGEVAVSRAGERLYAERGAQPREELVPIDGTRFRVGRQAAEITFFQDSAGRVTHAVVATQGVELRAPRVDSTPSPPP